ncbi:MAG: hypothetical protein QW270_07830 [Candidatus Bathyarchaeia archaeon]
MEYVKRLINCLNKCGIKYAFTGAFALSHYGHPRSSMDLDILVENDDKKLMNLANLLKSKDFQSAKPTLKKPSKNVHILPFSLKAIFPT